MYMYMLHKVEWERDVHTLGVQAAVDVQISGYVWSITVVGVK